MCAMTYGSHCRTMTREKYELKRKRDYGLRVFYALRYTAYMPKEIANIVLEYFFKCTFEQCKLNNFAPLSIFNTCSGISYSVTTDDRLHFYCVHKKTK